MIQVIKLNLIEIKDEEPAPTLADLEYELQRLTKWKYQYNSNGADGKIKQLTEQIELLK